MEISEVTQVSDLLLLAPMYQFLILLCFAVVLIAIVGVGKGIAKAIKGEPSEEQSSDSEFIDRDDLPSPERRADTFEESPLDSPKTREDWDNKIEECKKFDKEAGLPPMTDFDNLDSPLINPTVERSFGIPIPEGSIEMSMPIVIEVENLYDGENEVILFRDQPENWLLKITNPLRHSEGKPAISDIEQLFEGIKFGEPRIGLAMITLSEQDIIKGDVLSDSVMVVCNSDTVGRSISRRLSFTKGLLNTKMQCELGEPFQFNWQTQLSFTFAKKGKVTLYLYPVSVVDFGRPTLQEKMDERNAERPQHPIDENKAEMSENRAFLQPFVDAGMISYKNADGIATMIDTFGGGRSLTEIGLLAQKVMAGNAEMKSQLAEYSKSVHENNQYYKEVLAGQDVSKFRRELAGRILELQVQGGIEKFGMGDLGKFSKKNAVDNAISVTDKLLYALNPPQEANHTESQPLGKDESSDWGTGKPKKGVVFEDGKGGKVVDLIKKSKYIDSNGKPFSDNQYRIYAVEGKLSPKQAIIALDKHRKVDADRKTKIRMQAKEYLKQNPAIAVPSKKTNTKINKSKKPIKNK